MSIKISNDTIWKRTSDLHRTLNTNKKVNYKNFLHVVGSSWISEVQNQSESHSDDLEFLEKETTPRRPKQDPLDNCPVIAKFTNGKKLLVVGSENRSILQDGVKCVLHSVHCVLHSVKCVLHSVKCVLHSVHCVLHVRSKVKLDTFVNSALFQFTKGLVLRNTLQWWTTRLSTCSFCSLGLRSTICSVKP